MTSSSICIYEYSSTLDSDSDSESCPNLIPIAILNLMLCKLRIGSRIKIGIKFEHDSESECNGNEYLCMQIVDDVMFA